MNPLFDPRDYGISFDTRTNLPYIRVLKVVLCYSLMSDTEEVNVALCEDPLYKELEKYVLANPSAGKKKT